MHTLADYLRRRDELTNILVQYREDLASSKTESEREHLQGWISQMEKEQQQMCVLAGDQKPDGAEDFELIKKRWPSNRVLPPGRTFLSGLV